MLEDGDRTVMVGGSKEDQEKNLALKDKRKLKRSKK
jgi:hypothetical protein